jgi:hypothetical protein
VTTVFAGGRKVNAWVPQRKYGSKGVYHAHRKAVLVVIVGDP